MQDREHLWEDPRRGELFLPLRIDGKEFDPFDTENINAALLPKHYVYSGGIGLRAAPNFLSGTA